MPLHARKTRCSVEGSGLNDRPRVTSASDAHKSSRQLETVASVTAHLR